MLISDGSWDKFRDMSAAMGIQNRDGYNRQSSIGDIDGDGWLDMAIGCDTIGRPDRFGTPHSRLFVFQPKGAKSVEGTFVEIAGTLGLDDLGGYTGDPAKDNAGPGSSLRDLDNDGDLDLVQTYHADLTGAMQTEREAAIPTQRTTRFIPKAPNSRTNLVYCRAMGGVLLGAAINAAN